MIKWWTVCGVCGKKINFETIGPEASSAKAKLVELGWQVTPYRCPEHSTNVLVTKKAEQFNISL